ncbi:hypothetical protein AQUCO_01300275v1 [Aquilegia coerulea]|uniref:Uncharacterized protein n=1 Tax=Aquilegia coerulea TaxID=218851 RepID=A0A2G5E0Q9_AQUCA|nr:hypothetical protein AQUCO_01300275v1 [Aquilegia coerulea]
MMCLTVLILLLQHFLKYIKLLLYNTHKTHGHASSLWLLCPWNPVRMVDTHQIDVLNNFFICVDCVEDLSYLTFRLL